MSPEQQTLADVRAYISTLPPETQELVNAYALVYRTQASQEASQIAIALIGAEMAAK